MGSLQRSSEGHERRTVEETRHGWVYSLIYVMDPLQPRPVELHVRPENPDAGYELSAEVLRSAPLRKLQERARREMTSSHMGSAQRLVDQLPERITEKRDYALLAAAYVDLASRSHQSPIATMARAMNVSPNTLVARLRRARDMDLLAGSVSDAGARPALTKAAVALLRQAAAAEKQEQAG